jgi:hypothetical protein
LHRLTFATGTCINVPLWLLGGITEFMTGVDVMPLEWLETLRAMPSCLRVQHSRALWDEDVAGAEGASLCFVTLPHATIVGLSDYQLD